MSTPLPWIALPICAALVGGIGTYYAWRFQICRAIEGRNESRKRLGLSKTSKLGDPEIGEQVRYHNSAIYDDIRFFIKVSLAIVAGAGALGLATLAGSAGEAAGGLRRAMSMLAGVLELAAGFILFVSILAHQRGKICWWWRPPQQNDVPRWQETRALPVLVAIAIGIAIAIPLLLH